MSYKPTVNSVAWRAIQHLETLDIGAEVTTGALCDALGVPSGSLQACLEGPIKHGLLFKRQKDKSTPRSPVFWSLTDYSEGEKKPPLSSRSVFDLGASVKTAADFEEPLTQSRAAEKPTEIELLPALDSQQVLKAEAATPDATDRDAPATTSPVGGPTGAGQHAAACPAGRPARFALWSDGALQIERAGHEPVLLPRDEVERLFDYLNVMRGEVAA